MNQEIKSDITGYPYVDEMIIQTEEPYEELIETAQRIGFMMHAVNFRNESNRAIHAKIYAYAAGVHSGRVADPELAFDMATSQYELQIARQSISVNDSDALEQNTKNISLDQNRVIREYRSVLKKSLDTYIELKDAEDLDNTTNILPALSPEEIVEQYNTSSVLREDFIDCGLEPAQASRVWSGLVILSNYIRYNDRFLRDRPSLARSGVTHEEHNSKTIEIDFVSLYRLIQWFEVAHARYPNKKFSELMKPAKVGPQAIQIYKNLIHTRRIETE